MQIGEEKRRLHTSFLDVAQTAQKLFVIGFFTDNVNAGGDDPDRHAAPRAQHQHINDHLVMRRFLSREREKADQQLGIEQIPPIIRKPQTIGQ